MLRSFLFGMAAAIASFGVHADSKIIVPQGTNAPSGATLIADYGSYGLYQLADGQPSEMDRLLFEALSFDTQKDPIHSPNGYALSQPTGSSLQVIQFVGPVKQEWLDELKNQGVEPVHYVANNGYVVWTGAQGRAYLDNAARAQSFIQFSGVYHSFFKIGAALTRHGKQTPAGRELLVTVQMYRHAGRAQTESMLANLSLSQETPWEPVLAFQNARFRVTFSQIQAIASQPDVFWVNEFLPRELFDEVQAQIVAGNFNVDQSGPSAPGYQTWLDGFGFSTLQADYPVTDIVDGGIGNGTVNSGDRTFHEGGDLANPTRLSYVANCTGAADGGGPGGHGHINLSIAGGFDDMGGFPFQDPNGYLRGLGINPYGRFAGTRIFGPGFDLSACGGTDQGLIKSQQDNGALISSNSWGCSGCAGSYDSSSQAFDVGVRDSDLDEPLNQQLITLFAAGNSGPSGGTVGTPGNGKNMITVGASENQRPSDEDGNWTDGCAVGPTGADSAMDVIGFSSRGPAPGGRIKPEVIAPGTHIQGTASTNAAYDGSSVCDQFRPSGQATFAASSGTSHSTPALAGVASLIYHWIDRGLGNISTRSTLAPSPALMKAYMMAHPTHLTGVSANDTLPSNNQGYGQPTMGLLFDDAAKFIHDQSNTFDNTGEDWTWVGAAVDPARPVRIALAYTDQAGAVGTSPQVNDLNLSVESGGNTYLGNVFSGAFSITGGTADAANNYEAVFLPAGLADDLTITVSAFNIAGDGVPNSGDATDQDFAVVCYNCAQNPTYTLQVDPTSLAVCAPDDAVYTVNSGSILGFVEPVTLSANGVPAGLTTAFSVNPVVPGGSSVLTLGATGSGTPGGYDFTVDGVSDTTAVMKSRNVHLDLFDAVPGAPVLASPTDGAIGVSRNPMLSWSASSQEQQYVVEVDDDQSFGSIEYTATVTGTSHTVSDTLASNTRFYWRVRAINACGNTESTVFEFVTEALPGDCAMGSELNIQWMDDLEGDTSGYSSDGTQDTWGLTSARTHSGANAWFAQDVATVSDQRLMTPPVLLPTGEMPVSLRFWNYQNMEANTFGGGCYDGGILEVTTDGGINWDQVLDGDLLTDPYDGSVSTCCTNPIQDLNAWCGNPQDWTESIVDLSALAGETVQFRFRVGTDSSVPAEGWYVDDLQVQSCAPEDLDRVFSDSFE